MLSNLNAAHRQHKVTNNNSNSFIDILAVLLTGGVGMFIALLGLCFDNLPLPDNRICYCACFRMDCRI